MFNTILLAFKNLKFDLIVELFLIVYCVVSL